MSKREDGMVMENVHNNVYSRVVLQVVMTTTARVNDTNL